MPQASRAVLLLFVAVLLVHVLDGMQAGVGLGQAKRWLIVTFTGSDPGAPKKPGT